MTFIAAPIKHVSKLDHSLRHCSRGSVCSYWPDLQVSHRTISERGKRKFYSITPEALKGLYKHHHRDLMQRGMRNLALFEAYVEYCFASKHTVGEQLLDVRRDKKERAAFAAAGGEIQDEEEDDDEDDTEMDGRFRVELADPGSSPDPEGYDA